MSKPVVGRDQPLDFLRYELKQIRAKIGRRSSRARQIATQLANARPSP